MSADGKKKRSGGSILITLGEGGESRYDTNVNFFLEDYGIAINADAVRSGHRFPQSDAERCLPSCSPCEAICPTEARRVVPLAESRGLRV